MSTSRSKRLTIRLLSLAGALLIGAGILVAADDGCIDCASSPAEVTLFLGGLGLVVLAAVLGSWIGFAVMWPTIGLAALVGGAHGSTEARNIGMAFLATSAFAVVGLAGAAVWFRRRAAARQQLIATGGRGVAEVRAVRDTGVTINEQPRVEIDYRVVPADGSEPFTASTTEVVSRLDIPRPGQWRPVVFDRACAADTLTVLTDEDARTDPALRGLIDDATLRAAEPDGPGTDPLVEELERLNRLRVDGAITEDECRSLKGRLLPGGPGIGG